MLNANDFFRTKLFLVSTEVKNLFFFAYFNLLLILFHSVALPTVFEFGLVDSPPISIISAPSFLIYLFEYLHF